MMHAITAEKIRENIGKRLAEDRAELVALEAVKVNTKHTVMTNRAIEGAAVFNYLDINKALRVPYSVKYADGSTRYQSREITIYSYNDENGQEIGASGGLRVSRTLKPSEVATLLQEIIASKRDGIIGLEGELERANAIAQEHNELVARINQFNDGVSYASEAKIK